MSDSSVPESLQVYRLGEAARILDVGRRTLELWIAEGRLKAVRIGRKSRRVRRIDLEAFLAAGDES